MAGVLSWIRMSLRSFVTFVKLRLPVFAVCLLAVGIFSVNYRYNMPKVPTIKPKATVLVDSYKNRNISYYILYYNPPTRYKKLHNRYDVMDFRRCPYWDCAVTTRKEFISMSRAVIFNHYMMPDKPPWKPPEQKWIFTSSESPYHTHRIAISAKWRDKFDWVMSYRRDSHLFYGYGDIIHRQTPLVRDYDAVYQEKRLDAAAVISHCRTRGLREEYIREMQRYMPVEVFGQCGRECGPFMLLGNDSCHINIAKNFKFFLAFENSLCIDYTSEKLYHIFLLDLPIIPVLRGSFSAKKYVPPQTFVDTQDFSSPKVLASYLTSLGNDKERYIEMLKEKDKFSSKTSFQTHREGMCKLCEKLHSNATTQPVDILNWYFVDICTEPNVTFTDSV